MVTAKEETRKQYRERIEQTLLYIQDHLGEVLRLDELAREACFSAFHFHRIFTAFVGEGPGEYVQRLRIERAATKLVNTADDVTRIALDVGYETPAAMGRAFRKRFNCSPLEFRAYRREFLPGAPLSSQQNNKKEIFEVKPEIRTVPEKKVMYVRKTGSYDSAATEAWSTICRYAYSNKLVSKDSTLIGIGLDDPKITEESKIRYEACITIESPVKPSGEIGVKTIDGGTYAVFLHKGPHQNLYETYRAIYSGWLPESGEKLREIPCYEVYLNRDPHRTKPENLRTEIFVPLDR